MSKQLKEPYIILDEMGEEIEVTARQFIDMAIQNGWLVGGDVARAIQELIETALQSGIEFGRQIERLAQLEYRPSQAVVTRMEFNDEQTN